MNEALLLLVRQQVKKAVKHFGLKVIRRWARSAKPDIQFSMFANEFDIYITNPGDPKPHAKARQQDWKLKVEGESFQVWIHTRKRKR